MEEDFYFSQKQFLKGLKMPKSIGGLVMRRGDISLAKIDGVWKNFTESVPRGRKPLSIHDDVVLIGRGTNVEIVREQLLEEQIEDLINKVKN